MSDKPLYAMKLHDVIQAHNGSTLITRVPGGWVYTFHRLDCGQMNSVFVPYDREFRETEDGVDRSVCPK